MTTPAPPSQFLVLPDPPRLHWAIVLVASMFTAGLFGAGWLVIQANWARKIRGGNVPFFLSIAYVAVSAVGLIMRWRYPDLMVWIDWRAYFSLLTASLWIASVYTVRGELAAEPIGLNLGFIMPFFFGPLYFQYHLSDWYASANSGRPLGL